MACCLYLASRPEFPDQVGVVVMSLDAGGLGSAHRGQGTGALYQVRPQCSLAKHHLVRVQTHLLDDPVGHIHEGVTDDFPLDLRVCGVTQQDALLVLQEGVTVHELHVGGYNLDRQTHRGQTGGDIGRLRLPHISVVNVDCDHLQLRPM